MESDDTARRLQWQTYALLLREAQDALERGDNEGYRVAIRELAAHLNVRVDAPSDSLESAYEQSRERRMYWARLALASVLLVGLIVTIVIAVISENDSAATYIALVSGLTGIALGWVFGASTVQNVTTHSEKPGEAPPGSPKYPNP